VNQAAGVLERSDHGPGPRMTSLPAVGPSNPNPLLVLCFAIFLYPITIDGLGVNYAFMLMPIVALVFGRRICLPNATTIVLLALYCSIFFLASIFGEDQPLDGSRRTISFLLFVSVFSFAFVQIDQEMAQAFKLALVLISSYFSLISIYSFYALGGAALSFEAKDLIGSQRYGFIYLMAVWVLFTFEARNTRWLLLKYLAMLVIFGGMLMTFSRASIVSLTCTFGAYAFWKVLRYLRNPGLAELRRAGLWVGALVGVLLVSDHLFPIISIFFEERLLAFLVSDDKLFTTLALSETSEGTRLFIWGQIWDYVMDNPLTGSGFLGIWTLQLFDSSSGSAHNQFADVLFRTGFLGCFAYLFALWRIGLYLARTDLGLFWGFIGSAFYGLFHESFKEPHGGFVLAFLYGMWVQGVRYRAPETVALLEVPHKPSATGSPGFESQKAGSLASHA